MTQVAIPVDMMEDSSLHHRITPQSIRDEALRMLQAKLYTELDFDEMLAEDEPEEEKGSRRKPRGKLTPYDMVPRHELRFVRALRWSEASVMQGGMKIGLWRASMELRYKRALDELQQEQPNCDWRLVACKVTRANRRRVVTVEGIEGSTASDAAAMAAVMAETNYDNPRTVRVAPSFRQVEEPDVLWHVPLVFCDIAKADLVDPQLAAQLNGVEGPMSQYIRTRQLRFMPPGLRRNRGWAVDLITEFRDAGLQAEMAAFAPAPRFNDDQIAAARMLREQGQPPALIATLLGATLEEVQKALA